MVLFEGLMRAIALGFQKALAVSAVRAFFVKCDGTDRFFLAVFASVSQRLDSVPKYRV